MATVTLLSACAAPAKRVQKMVSADELDNAHAYWLERKAALAVKEGPAAVRQLADKLNARYVPEAQSLTSALAGIAAPPPLASWGQVKGGLARAEALDAEYARWELLREPPWRSDSILELQKTAKTLRDSLTAGSGEAFKRFDHAGSTAFFGQYPITLEPELRGKLIDEHAALWQAALGKLNEDRAISLIRELAAGLDDKARLGRMSEALMQRLARIRMIKAPMSLRERIVLGRLVARALPEAGDPARNLNLIVVGDDDIATGNVAGGSAAGSIQRTGVAQFGGALARHAKTRPDTPLIVVVAGPVGVTEVLGGERRATGQRVVGRLESTNPDVARLRAEVRQLETEYRDAEAEDARMQAASRKPQQQAGTGTKSAMYAQMLNGLSVVSRKSDVGRELANKRNELAAAPATITTEQKANYAFIEATMARKVQQEFAVYVLEGNGGAQRLPLQRSQNRSVDLSFNVDANDPEMSTVSARDNGRRATLAGLDRSAVRIALSEVVDNILDDRQKWIAVDAKRLAVSIGNDLQGFSRTTGDQDRQARTAFQQAVERVAGMAAPGVKPEHVRDLRPVAEPVLAPRSREPSMMSSLADSMTQYNQQMEDLKRQQRQREEAAAAQRQQQLLVQQQQQRQQQESAERWRQAQEAANEQQRQQQQRSQEAVDERLRQQQAQQHNGGGAGGNGGDSQSNRKATRFAKGCVHFVGKYNEYIENSCSFPVWVRWADEGVCKPDARGSASCAAGPISPGKKEYVVGQKGKIAWAACEYPGSPRDWIPPHGKFSCLE